MGQTSADAQRELESVRADLSATLGELERRARHLTEMPARAGSSPVLRVVAGVTGAGLVTLVAYRAMAAYRERRRPSRQLQRRAEHLADDLGERWSRARHAFPLTVKRRDRVEDLMALPRQEPSRFKSLLWMGLTAGLVALFGLLARRASVAIWEAAMHEPPPTSNV